MQSAGQKYSPSPGMYGKTGNSTRFPLPQPPRFAMGGNETTNEKPNLGTLSKSKPPAKAVKFANLLSLNPQVDLLCEEPNCFMEK